MIEIMNLPSPFDKLPVAATFPVKLTKGTALFHQNSPALGPYFVVSGGVEMIRHTQAGTRLILFRATVGDILAEACLFSESYHCDCVASQDSHLIRLDKSALLSQMMSNAEFSGDLVKRLARQVQGYRRHFELLAIPGAEDRVFAAICDKGQTGTVVQLADDICLSPEATYRALSALVKQGRLQRQGRGRYQVAVIGEN